MSVKMPCPHCEALRDVEETTSDETLNMKGRDVAFKARFFKCTVCGGEFESGEQMDANLDAAREEYSRRYESPAPKEIKALRARYGASQKAFGLLLGFGELTVNSYEQGATPDSTNRLLLKLAEDPHCFKSMYGINKFRIGAIQRKRIEESEGFRAVTEWAGMEALAGELTPDERERLTTCANNLGLTLSGQAAVYVRASSCVDYFQIALEYTRSQAISREISTVSVVSAKEKIRVAA